MEKDKKDFYKGQADKYMDFASSEAFSWKFIERPALNKHLSSLLKQNPSTLDLGCGGGRTTSYLLSKGVEKENIVGVDLNEKMISIARKKLPEVEFICRDISELEFKSKKFDLIVSSMVFHYLDDAELRKVLRNCHRWLKEGGVLFCIITHPVRMVHGNLEEYFSRGWKKQKTPWGTEIPHYRRTVSDYINNTIEANFEIKAVGEPEVSTEGKEFPEEYDKYTSFPARLLIKAVK